MINNEREQYERKRNAQPTTGIKGMFSQDDDFLSPPDSKEYERNRGGWNMPNDSAP